MIPNPSPGKFIVFEGIDGCGKSTQLRRAYAWLNSIGTAVKATKEPDKEGKWGKKIYTELKLENGLHKTNSYGFQAWFACDSRINFVKTVIPFLGAGVGVLSDRGRPSMVYAAESFDQRESRLSLVSLMQMNCAILGGDFILPDLTLIFDVTSEEGVKRLRQKRLELDHYERERFLERIRGNYKMFADSYPDFHCKMIDGMRSEDEVFEDVKKAIMPLLGLPPTNI